MRSGSTNYCPEEDATEEKRMKKGLSLGIYLKEMRIKSWLKNLFVLSPIIFSLDLFDGEKFLHAVVLTFAFCLISSAIYVLNDMSDVENDRKHEVKKNRPIAAGLISLPRARLLLACLTIGGFGLALVINFSSFLLMLVYVVTNILYSKWLKKKPIIDCFCIALGFLLRVMVGGTIVSAGYGFVCGAYMPISQFSDGLQKVISLLPGTYGTSLLRNHVLRGVFEEMGQQGFPAEVVEAIKDSVDCNLYFFGDQVSLGAMYLILGIAVLVLIAVYVLLNVLGGKGTRAKG